MKIAIVGCRPPKLAESTPANMALFQRLYNDAHQFAMSLPNGTTIVSGGAKGIDHAGASAVPKRWMHLHLIEHHPDYNTYGSKDAPLERNHLIVRDCDELHAWPAPWSRGTWHVINAAKKAGKRVVIHDSTDMKSQEQEEK